MKLAKVRKTTATGEQYGHAPYSTLENAIIDMYLYHQARKLNSSYSSPDAYVDAIHQKGYFEAPLEAYKAGVNIYYDAYFKEI